MDAEMEFKTFKKVGLLIHRPTHTQIVVFEPIGWFKRMMIRWCFGLEYRKEEE